MTKTEYSEAVAAVINMADTIANQIDDDQRTLDTATEHPSDDDRAALAAQRAHINNVMALLSAGPSYA